MARKFKTMDGNNAAAYVSYAFTEVAGIYPITRWQTMLISGRLRGLKTYSALP